MIKKLKPVDDMKTVTELNPSHCIRLNPNRLREVIQALRKFNRSCYDGRIKTLVIQKMIQINRYMDDLSWEVKHEYQIFNSQQNEI